MSFDGHYVRNRGEAAEAAAAFNRLSSWR